MRTSFSTKSEFVKFDFYLEIGDKIKQILNFNFFFLSIYKHVVYFKFQKACAAISIYTLFYNILSI